METRGGLDERQDKMEQAEGADHALDRRMTQKGCQGYGQPHDQHCPDFGPGYQKKKKTGIGEIGRI